MNKSYFTSSAKRHSYYFYNNLNFQIMIKHFKIKTINNAGRNTSGKIVIRTKGKLSRLINKINVNNNFRYLKMGIISTFNFIPFKNKILSLIFFSNGSICYYLASEQFKLFSIFFFNNDKKFKKLTFIKIHLMLIQIKKLSLVSCLELTPGSGSKYAKSSGVKAKIIKFDHETHSVFIQLPSGVKKIFSFYSFVMIGRIANVLHNKCTNHKSGY